MSSLKAGVLAGLATILISAFALVGGIAITRNTSVLAGWVEKPAELKPVTDEQEAQAKQRFILNSDSDAYVEILKEMKEKR